MTSSTDIAVLMPAYNPGSEIVDTLDSLKAQDVPFKLYVIDDGSARKPDYQALLKGFDHTLILSPQNIGVNEARNPALKQIIADGFKYVALIDCGDVAHPQRLRKQKAFLDQNPDISILGCGIRLVYVLAGVSYNKLFPETPAGVRKYMLSNLPVSHPTLMLRSEVFKSVGLYTGAFHAAEDYELIRRADKAGLKIANLPDVLLDKIETEQSISQLKRLTQLDSRLAIQWHYANLLDINCWTGMLRTLAIRLTPRSWITAIKHSRSKQPMLIAGQASKSTS
jgi:glycosyltransferase involved in cell wall biosynthesis